jgi:plasmid stability protein
MSLTIDLPEEQQAVLAARAREHGISAEEYARQVLAHDLEEPETSLPAVGAAQFEKEHGVWVYRTGVPMPSSLVEDTLQNMRRQREESFFGNVPR